MKPRRFGRYWWRMELKREDCWVGVFWKHVHGNFGHNVHVWVCVVPMVPVHVWWSRTWPL